MRIAIVNDLALAREVLRRLVLSAAGYTVAWMAADGEEAVAKTAADRPDVILMDLVMPKLDGVEATRRIMRASPCPILVVTVSVETNFALVCRALGAGGLDAVDTPTLGPGGTVVNGEPLLSRLARLAAAKAGVATPAPLPPGPPAADLPFTVAIAASTGGPDALAVVLGVLPSDLPAVVLVNQHIAAEFATGLADQLARRCRLPVRPAREGEVLKAGAILLAASDDHLVLGPDHRLGYTSEPRAYPYRPSADVLFHSLAARGPRQGVGVVLTGMGPDGADGLARLRSGGWHTIAQDEATSVVYGMPRAAVERHAAADVLPLDRIGPTIVARVRAAVSS
jgi:two-component system response regulator WspF